MQTLLRLCILAFVAVCCPLAAQPVTANDQPAAALLIPADPAAALARAGTHEPRFIQQCGSSHWTGRVISSQAIHVRGFSCGVSEYGPEFKIWNARGAIMNVQIANPTDASMMQPGKWVTVYGRALVATEHNTVDYLIVKDAMVKAEFLSFCAPHEQTQSNC